MKHCVTILLLVVGLILPGTWSEAFGTSPDRAIEELATLYQNLRTVSLRAELGIERRTADEAAPGLQFGKGSFEYVADRDGRYRVKYVADPRLGLAQNAEIAFDGEFFQYLFAETGILTFRRSEPEMAPVAIPNPFMLPARFLNTKHLEDLFLPPRLSNVSDRARWQRVSTARIPSRGDEDDLLLQGGVVDGTSLIVRIVANHEGRIGKIFEEDDAGNVKSELHFMDYASVSGRDFPHRIDYSYFHENGVRGTHARYRILELEFDAPLPAESFRIEVGEEQEIWDEEAAAFVDRLPR